jgi:hypothetical protein
MRRITGRITRTAIIWAILLGGMAAASIAAVHAAKLSPAICISRCGSCGSGCGCDGNPGSSGCHSTG